MKRETQEIFMDLLCRYPQLKACEGEIAAAFEALKKCFAGGGTLYMCGNGGSASDCAHIAGELLKSFRTPRPLRESEKMQLLKLGKEGEYLASRLQRGLPAVSLCEYTALSTAFANDVEGKLTYAQLVNVFAKEGDVLLCLSTSGNSANCVCAALTAKSKGIEVISLTGETGGKLKDLSSVCIRVPARETFLVQELHLPVYHCLCAMLEKDFFG